MIHKDDILEDALTFGISFSAKKHDIDRQEVVKVVDWFQKDIEDFCGCDLDFIHNNKPSMCWMCPGSPRLKRGSIL